MDIVKEDELLSLPGCDVGLEVVDNLVEAFDIVACAFELV